MDLVFQSFLSLVISGLFLLSTNKAVSNSKFYERQGKGLAALAWAGLGLIEALTALFLLPCSLIFVFRGFVEIAGLKVTIIAMAMGLTTSVFTFAIYFRLKKK